MEDNALTIELVVNQNIQVVLKILNVDRNVNTLTTNGDGDWLAVILVLKEQSEVLTHSR